ncbi:MAG: SUMF1/EgtB/PvdO family nonheme iron enzyme, partial [Verrucomicrobia bacterium]|nr:SUMF1/EgtB/PvdO family nonheme iron enzyme [Verrucomicrobiota bacterium]
LAGVLWWAPWKTPQRESVTVISQGQPLQPSEPPRQEVTASVTPPAPVAPPAQLAPATPSAPVADSAPRTPQSAVPPAIAPFDAAQARQHQEAWAKHLQVPVEMTNSIGMKFVLIPPGEFLMGSTPEERDRALDEASKVVKGRFYPDRIPGEVPQHRIRITKPFYLGVFEVTQEEYEQLAGKNPSQFAASGKQAAKIARMDTRRFPVEEVTFDDASQFAGRLSERAQEKSAGWKYRLPTEAEWEYACRAGTATRYHFGDDPSLLGDYGWFLGNSDHRTHPVGEKRPNAWGLHDMHGNALEWCQDWFSTTYFAESPADDPPGPSSGSVRVERGGTPILYPVGCRSASRHYQESGKPNYIGAGFRLVCEIPTSAEPKSATTPSTPAALASQPPASSAQAPPSPPSAAAAPTTDSFQSLFNGRDLTGWTPREIMGRGDAVTYRPATGGWVIQNGELACVT